MPVFGGCEGASVFMRGGAGPRQGTAVKVRAAIDKIASIRGIEPEAKGAEWQIQEKARMNKTMGS